VRFEIADVLELPYPARSFDIASIAFGIRNAEIPRADSRRGA
jgi:ubiquinone/menaquinone biosynthesis C-methylase UbiE